MAARATAASRRVAALLAEQGVAPEHGPVVEVGSGAHGLIWCWPSKHCIGVDPLALFYRQAFAFLQRDGPASVAAQGERLPLPSAMARIVLCDNVLDHTQEPGRLLSECARLLRPGGALFLGVDTHHRVYGYAGSIYNALFRLGLRRVVPAFTNHPFHFSPEEVDRLLSAAGFEVLYRLTGRSSGSLPPAGRPRRLYDVLKRIWFKNARLEIVARFTTQSR